jgi:hypothetical protein
MKKIAIAIRKFFVGIKADFQLWKSSRMENIRKRVDQQLDKE